MKKVLLSLVVVLTLLLTAGIFGCSYTVIVPQGSASATAQPTISPSASADPNTFSFEQSNIEIGIGEANNLASLLTTNITNTTLFWEKTGGASFITLDTSLGNITGVNQGTARVRVYTTYQGKQYSAEISILVRGNYINVYNGDDDNPVQVSSVILYVGDELDLSSYIRTNIPLDQITLAIESGNSYITLSDNTISALTASGNDFANVTFTANAPYSASYSLKVYVKDLPTFELNMDNIYLYVGGTVDLSTYVTTGITSPELDFELTDGTDYASINGNNASGVAVGTANLEASVILSDGFLNNKLSDTANIVVVSAGTFGLSVEDISLVVGGTYNSWSKVTQNLHTPVTASECTWEITEGTAAASVNAAGVITGTAIGSATLNVSLTQYGLTFTDTATVSVAAPFFRFSTTNLEITVGDIVDLNNYVQTNLSSPILVWSQTSGETYATIDTETGEVSGLTVGVAVIKADTMHGTTPMTASLSITVATPSIAFKSASGGGGIETSELTIFSDEEIPLYNYMVTNILGPTGYLWTITDGGAFASIDSVTGLLTATGVGDVTVNVATTRATGTATKTVVIHIVTVPDIEFTVNPLDAFVGDVISLQDLVTITDFGALTKDDIVWTTESTNVSLTSEGVLTVNSVGVTSPQIIAALTTNDSNVGPRTFEDTITVTTEAQPQMEFTVGNLTIDVDEIFDLKTEILTSIVSPSYSWEILSGADTIITMAGADGVITGIEGGEASVKVSIALSYQTLEDTITVTVLPVNPIVFDTTKVVIYKNDLQHTRVSINSLNDTIVSNIQLESYKPNPLGGVESITIPEYQLIQNTDYKYSYSALGSTLTLFISYLDTLDHCGEYTLVITDSIGTVQNVQLLVVEQVITNAAQLQAIGDTRESLLGSYILGCDIDCSSIPYFEPLGEYYNDNYWTTGGTFENMVFMGVLDGAGHSIYNVNIDSLHCARSIHRSDYSALGGSITGGRNIGFFSYIGQNAIVRNIKFFNMSVTTTRQIAGVVAGTVQGTIENVIVDCLTYKSGSTYYAANVGTSFSSSYSCAVNTGGWEGGGFYGLDCFTGTFAGIVGEYGKILHCISMATINATSTKSIRGFVGKSHGTITSCYAFALSPFNGSLFKNFASNVVSLSPATDVNDRATFVSVKNSVPVGITLVDLNHLMGGFAYIEYKGYWDETTNVLVPQKFGSDPVITYDNDYYLFINNSGLKTLTELTSSALYSGFSGADAHYNYDTNAWAITNGVIPALIVTYTSI